MVDKRSRSSASLDLSTIVGPDSVSQDYRRGQAVFLQGDKADAIFYIEHGEVKLTVMSTGGKKAVIDILSHGDMFGEECLPRLSLRRSTAMTLQLSTITRVNRAAIVHIIQQRPEFARLFISHLLSRIGRVEQNLVDQVCSSSEKRLARILLMLADSTPRTRDAPGLAKIDQETLAEMVGTTRSRVSYFMNRFRNRGFIDYNGKIRVHEALRTFLADEEAD